MLTYDLKKREKMPMYEYLYKCIREDIISGRIKENSKLPSKREMAKNHNISVVTVENAYAQLLVEGFIYAKEKKGYYASVVEINTSQAVKYKHNANKKDIMFHR